MADSATEVAVIEETVAKGAATDVASVIQGLNNPGSAVYSSISSDSFEDKLAIAAALTTSVPIDENLNKEIQLTDFIVQPVDLTDDQGNVNTAPRVVLIDEAGVAYHATSIGLLSSLRNIASVLGAPSTWPHPVPIQVVEQKGNNGYKFFTIKFL